MIDINVIVFWRATLRLVYSSFGTDLPPQLTKIDLSALHAKEDYSIEYNVLIE